MGAGGYTSAIGGILHATGNILAAGEADKTREAFEKVANMPGLDTGKITGEALGDIRKYTGEASELSQRIAAANQANLNLIEESAMPGAKAARQTALDRILSLFSDDKTWMDGVTRRAAAMNVQSGLFGSNAGVARTLRLSDTEQNQRTQLGTGLLANLLGTLRLANTPGVQAFLSPLPSELINIRGVERANKQSLLAKHALMPGWMGVFSQNLMDVGGAMAGAGAAMSSSRDTTVPQVQSGSGGTPSGDSTQGSWWKNALHLYQGKGTGPG